MKLWNTWVNTVKTWVNTWETWIIWRRGFLKLTTTTAAAAAALLTWCWTSNEAPTVWKENLKYITNEGETREIPFSKIIKDAKILDPNNDKINLEVFWDYDSSIVIEWEKIIFTTPSIEDNQKWEYKIIFRVKDSRGKYSDKNIEITFVSNDLENDSPLEFNDSDLVIDEIVKVWDDFKFTVNPKDYDWIDSIYYTIKDSNQNQVNWAYIEKWVEQSISWLAIWAYTIEVLVEWTVWGENEILVNYY